LGHLRRSCRAWLASGQEEISDLRSPKAKRQLVFTAQPIHEIAYDLAFSDPSHFTRFFRKQTGTTPQAFREGRGG
jgi:AraC-like DNA-binding protein